MELNNQEAIWNIGLDYDYDEKYLYLYTETGMQKISIEKWNNKSETDAEFYLIELQVYC